MRQVTKLIAIAAAAALIIIGVFVLRNPTARTEIKVLLGMEAPPQITPLAAIGPTPMRAAQPPATIAATRIATAAPAAAPTSSTVPTPAATPTATAAPTLTPTPAPVEVNGRLYDAYIPAAVKQGQLAQYTCEFDAAWVVLQTFGIDASVDEIIARTPIDTSIEPYFEETGEGFVIHGGDIASAFSGDYLKNFLARTTGSAMAPVFASFGVTAAPVNDRAGVEAALRRGALVWMKTTVDFKPWRPAAWVMPDGRAIQTVLGNDHAVVAIGFNSDVVAIRDVLGPTSSNWRRPLEYEVDWETFMKAWGAQSFDGLAVDRPGSP
jgi:hypothetical protein